MAELIGKKRISAYLEITGLQMMLKLVFLHSETEGDGMNRTGSGAKCAVLPNFVLIDKILQGV
jgi:hypothetical protein